MSLTRPSKGTTTRHHNTHDKLDIAGIIDLLTTKELPFRITAFDGSAIGPEDSGITLRIATEEGLRHIVTAPGDLGLARAYVTDGLVAEGVHPGDPYEAFKRLRQGVDLRLPTASEMARIARSLGRESFSQPPIPEVEGQPRWRRHAEHLMSKAGISQAAISHHYDVSNDFYERFLGKSMTYTCAVYADPSDSLDEAQERKYELICRKLALKPGMRLLDVGCGWGGMVRYAAKHYGVKATGITLSKEQATWAQEKIRAEGLQDVCEVRHGDFREAPGWDYDAISSIGLIEHLGVDNYDEYFTFCFERLRPGGRMLQHNITRKDDSAGYKAKAFIDRYVFPDGELASPGAVMSFAHNNGFEVYHSENLRRSYALTLRDWCANLRDNWDQCVEEVGRQRAKLWGIYMAGCRLGFNLQWVELHQYLLYRPYEDGTTDFPLRPDWIG